MVAAASHCARAMSAYARAAYRGLRYRAFRARYRRSIKAFFAFNPYSTWPRKLTDAEAERVREILARRAR